MIRACIFIFAVIILISGCSHRVETSPFWEKRLKNIDTKRSDKKSKATDDTEEEDDSRVNEFDEDDVDKSKKILQDDDDVPLGEQPEISSVKAPNISLKHPSMNAYKVNGTSYFPAVVDVGTTVTGVSSWYGPDFNGKKTSNGEIYDMYEFTAAHKTLPMHTIVKVRNLKNGKEVNVRINDRGPFVKDRIIDLSKAAAKTLDMTKDGSAPVMIEVLGFNSDPFDPSSRRRAATKEDLYVRKMKNYYVQIGSFGKFSGAKEYQEKFEKIGEEGYHATIKTSEINGKTIFRVVISGFDDDADAREYIKSHPGFRNAFFVRD